MWKPNEPPPLRLGRDSECPAAASAKACSPRTGTRVLSRSAAAADAAGDSRRRHAAARTVQVLLSAGGSDTNGTTAVYSGAAERVEGNGPSRPPPTMARVRARCRGLTLVGDVWRHAIRCTHAALESISCVRYGNDCKWEQRQHASKVHVKRKERPLKEVNLMKKR